MSCCMRWRGWPYGSVCALSLGAFVVVINKPQCGRLRQTGCWSCVAPENWFIAKLDDQRWGSQGWWAQWLVSWVGSFCEGMQGAVCWFLVMLSHFLLFFLFFFFRDGLSSGDSLARQIKFEIPESRRESSNLKSQRCTNQTPQLDRFRGFSP